MSGRVLRSALRKSSGRKEMRKAWNVRFNEEVDCVLVMRAKDIMEEDIVEDDATWEAGVPALGMEGRKLSDKRTAKSQTAAPVSDICRAARRCFAEGEGSSEHIMGRMQELLSSMELSLDFTWPWLSEEEKESVRYITRKNNERDHAAASLIITVPDRVKRVVAFIDEKVKAGRDDITEEESVIHARIIARKNAIDSASMGVDDRIVLAGAWIKGM